MPGDPLSRPLIEIAHDLREKRITARELVEAAIARHERFGERLHAYSFWTPEPARAVAARRTRHSPPGYRPALCKGCRSRSRTCSPPPDIPASPDRAGACPPSHGSMTDRWSRRYAVSSGSSWARPIWSNSRSGAPAATVIMGRRSIRGTRPRTARSVVPRAGPGSVCWNALLCSRSAATRPARCAFPHA